MNADLKSLPEVWNASFCPHLFFFFPGGKTSFMRGFHARHDEWLLLPGNRHNNDTGALSRPAFVVFPSSLQ